MSEQNKGTLGEQESIVEIVLARENPLEKKERAYRCQHGNCTLLCLTCAGLSASDVKKWNRLRTGGRHINPRESKLNSQVFVKISRSDCVLVSRSGSTVPAKEISDWYECLGCGRTTEMPASELLAQCPGCGGSIESIAEPFQRHQFSAYIGNGKETENYGGNHSSVRKLGEIIVRDLYSDPNSGFQKGGTGYLRIPLDAPRNSRVDPPEWLADRELFIRTLKSHRAARAERILYKFYIGRETDHEIAESERWSKDAIKNERHALVRRGNHFFSSCGAKHPPSPAMHEETIK